MEKLKLNTLDLQNMRQFYEEELEKTLNKLMHIQSVLEKLGAAPTGQIAASTSVMEKKEASSKTSVKSRKQKRGPKPFWEDRILKRLSALGKPVTYEELTDDIMIAFSIPAEERIKIKQSINNVIHRLRNESKKIGTFSVGRREKLIALKKWFDEAGEIKDEFKHLLEKKFATIKPSPAPKRANKVSTDAVPAPVKRRGRPVGSKNKTKPVVTSKKSEKAPRAASSSAKVNTRSTRKIAAKGKK